MQSPLEELDHALLLLINRNHSGFLDVLMITFSDKFFWSWLYLLLLAALIYRWKWKGLAVFVIAIVTILLADIISVKLFKETIERYRPCHNLELRDILRLATGKCGGQYGFVSSHATNTACLAIFMLTTGIAGFRNAEPYRKVLASLLVLYVLLNCYSRIYLAAHYPSDVLTGALLGASAGFLSGIATRRMLLGPEIR